VSLSSPSGHADLELAKSKVTAFLADCHGQVPAGRESNGIDWNNELHMLLRTRNT
jgi:hypothetical protein